MLASTYNLSVVVNKEKRNKKKTDVFSPRQYVNSKSMYE